MSPVLFFYLADFATSVKVIMFFVILILLVALCIRWFYYVDMVESFRPDQDMLEKAKDSALKLTRLILPTILTLAFIIALIPSKQTMFLMMGAKTIQEISANPRVQSLADNSLKLIESKIQEYTIESQKEEKK